ncbi:MAG TPA: hypothetical protein VKU38_01060, partial [Ktedonobacteraceae bacterium]|nr:hypothetical protein [Ktedonobacteraceae bacterium]
MAKSILAAQRSANHPIITRCSHSPQGLSSFAEGSPYLFPQQLEIFIRAVRPDIALMKLEPSCKVFRQIDTSEEYPIPEACTPYVEANSLGFYLKPLLPLVFVRNSRGEPLMEARVALKYLRENASRFSTELDTIAYYARRIFRSDEYEKLQPRYPRIFSDVIQPYNMFTKNHVSLRLGLWVHTPPGVSTAIGPPINQIGPLSILTGAIETDWHHFQLFVVAIFPEFEGQVHIIEPDQVIAQLYFVNRYAHEHTEVRFSHDDPGGEQSYSKSWNELSSHLIHSGKGKVVEHKGIASLDISCPHCYVSITAAAEYGVSEEHVSNYAFHSAYKILKRAYKSLASSP